MANYSLTYTGAQIQAALDKIVGSTINFVSEIVNIKTLNTTTTAILNGTTTIHDSLYIPGHTYITKQDNKGQLVFCDSTPTAKAILAISQVSSVWNFIISNASQDFLLMDTTKGNITIHNHNNNNSWIRCFERATIWSDISATGSGATGHLGMKTPSGRWCLGTYNNERLYFVYCTDTNVNSNNNVVSASIQFAENGKIYGASFGDYAETRQASTTIPGTCVKEVGDGTLIPTTARLERGCHVVSDTYGMVIGPEEEVPIAVCGRVLVHIYEGREEASKHIGWPVCSGPNGTVSIMTEEEEQKYPSRIIGTISEIPNYDVWGDNNIEVNGRIWIHIK